VCDLIRQIAMEQEIQILSGKIGLRSHLRICFISSLSECEQDCSMVDGGLVVHGKSGKPVYLFIQHSAIEIAGPHHD
jgi:hypothetical protein